MSAMYLAALFFSVLSAARGSQYSSVHSHSLSVGLPKPPAFLQHQDDDACNCAFNDACSCDGALEFMTCIRDGCNSGICQCNVEDGENHFLRACQEMADGCPGLGMECGPEQAKCGDDTVTWYGKENLLSRRYQKMNEEKFPPKDTDTEDEEQASLEDDKEDQDLPAGWKKVWSKEHERYYYINTNTDETTWKKPTSPAEGGEEDEDEEGDEGEEQTSLANEDLPPGWEALWSKDYEKVYYSNAETGEVTWTKPKMTKEQAKKAKTRTTTPKPDVVPKPHYHAKVKKLHSHEHHIFAKGTITAILVLCLTVCLASAKDNMISSNTWSTIDAVVTTFLSLAWYYVTMHALDFYHYKGLEKLYAHLTIATILLLASSLISWFMQKMASTDKDADMSRSVNIFNNIFDPIVAWCNAGAVSTAQQLAKPSEIGVLAMTGAMVLFYIVLGVVWYFVIGAITKKGWSEGTISNLTGSALAAGIVLWVHMLLVGNYQTVEDPHPKAPNMDKTLVLNCFGLLYVVLACLITKPVNRELANTDKGKQYVKYRTLTVLNVFVGWLPYYSCVCSLGHLIIDNWGYQEGAIEARLLMALVTTFLGFGLIILCAKVKAIREDTVITGILVGLGGFMVGAAWSGLLNNSINQMVKGYKHPFVTKLEVISFLTVCILPTYFYYLKPLIDEKTAS
jgi:hypothetical protein